VLDDATLSRLADRREEAALGRFLPGDPVAVLPSDQQPHLLSTPTGHSVNWYADPDRIPTRAVWTADRARALTLSGDRFVRLWDGATGARLATLPGGDGHVLDAVVHPHDQRFATASTSGEVSLWDRDGAPLAVLPAPRAQRLLYSPDGELLVVGCADATLRGFGPDGAALWVRPAAGPVSALGWTAQGELLSGTEGGQIEIWGEDDAATPVLPAHDGPVRQLGGFGPGGYSVGGTGARLFDAEGHVVRALDSDLPQALAVHPDQRLLFVSGRAGRGELWDLAGERVAELVGHEGGVSTVDFSPDGSRILTAGNDGTPRVWDLSGQLLFALQGEPHPTSSARFSLDGRHIVTASGAVTIADPSPIRLWTSEGERLEILGRHPQRVYALGFGSTGRLLSWSEDAAVQIYELDPATLLSEAQRRLAEIPTISPSLGTAGTYGSLY
jgi:WD40 repeat protein